MLEATKFLDYERNSIASMQHEFFLMVSWRADEHLQSLALAVRWSLNYS